MAVKAHSPATFTAPEAWSGLRPGLRSELERVARRCISCELCLKECAFLRAHGKPAALAQGYDPADPVALSLPFECSLCGLCAAVCPVGVNPQDMFLEMRRETVARGAGDYPEHGSLLGFERRGVSRRYTWYALPQGCRQVFFPGCNLPGSRPAQTWAIYERLRQTDPALGLVLDCCTKPSRDLGREDYFQAMFGEMRQWLLDQGVREVLVACPNCLKVFRTHGGELKARTVYEVLAEPDPPGSGLQSEVTMHDPCCARGETGVHTAARRLLQGVGLKIQEMKHHGARTMCCGEGGAVGFVNPGLAQTWVGLRKDEAKDRRVVTYCGGCAKILGGEMPTSHLLDVYLDPQAALGGRSKVSKAPLTYLNRLRLKKKVRREVPAAVSRERTFSTGAPAKSGALKRMAWLLPLFLRGRQTKRGGGMAGKMSRAR